MSIEPILHQEIQKFVPGSNSSFYEVTICIEIPEENTTSPNNWQWDSLTNPYPSKVSYYENCDYKRALDLGLVTANQFPDCDSCNDTGFSLYPATGIALEYIGFYIGYIPKSAFLSSRCPSCVDSRKPTSNAQLEAVLSKAFRNSTYSQWCLVTIRHPDTDEYIPTFYDPSDPHISLPKVDRFSDWIKDHKEELLEIWF